VDCLFLCVLKSSGKKIRPKKGPNLRLHNQFLIVTVCLQFLAHKNQFEVLTVWFLKFPHFGMWRHGSAHFEGNVIRWNAGNCLPGGVKTAITNWSLSIHLLFSHKFFHGLSVNCKLSQTMSFVEIFVKNM